jgi:WS/DGAT/MGAT family acyltransferase
LFADNMRRGLRQWGHALAALAHPVAVGRGAAHGWREVRKLLATDPVAATSLNRVIGPDRTFALVRGRLDEAKNIAHAHDATVNDVLLTVIAGGLRALLLARGESVDDAVVRIDVPLTLRPQQAREQARGNFISQLFVPVPLGIADPVLRLKHISADTAVRKAEPHVSAGVVLSSRLVRRLVRKVLQRHPVNVTTADLPGPPIALYFAGAPVLEVFPVLPLMANVSLGVGALSYAGQFNLTVIGDRDTYPDLDVFTRGLRAEWAALTG